MPLDTVGRMPPSRAPLPPGVYWRRRAFVLGLAFALVFVIARWLTAGGDGKSGDPAAEQAGAATSPSLTVTADPKGEKKDKTETDPTVPVGPATPTLAAPEGNCAPSDVYATPSVAEGAVAGRDVVISLSLQTRTSEACTWEVGPDSLVVKVGKRAGEVWTTRQCPSAIPAQSVVVRRTVATVVQLTWVETRESNDKCTRRAGWAMPGAYTVSAASLGGEPASADFTLAAPAPATVQVTPKPDKVKKQKLPKTPVN